MIQIHKNLLFYSRVLLKNSFINKSFLGLRLNISSDIEDLTRKFSKGHKSEIKKQSDKKYFLNITKIKKLILMILNRWFLIMWIILIILIFSMKFIKNKILIVYENDLKNFSSIFSLTNNTAEYFLDNNASNNHHSLILNSIKYFKKLNYIKYINMGLLDIYTTIYHYRIKRKIYQFLKKVLEEKNIYFQFLKKIFLLNF